MVVVSSYYYEENTSHRQSIYQQTVQRFQISLRETFHNFVSLRKIEKHDKSAVVWISAVFGTI